MENLMFCLNATGPIFLMMVFGLFLRKVGILDEDFANRMNKFVFKIPLPFLLFCCYIDKHHNLNTCFLSVEG